MIGVQYTSFGSGPQRVGVRSCGAAAALADCGGGIPVGSCSGGLVGCGGV